MEEKILPFQISLIKENKQDKNTSQFIIEGLYPGYGTTLGSALRRVLLSSLEGSAITQVKIKGVSHEFSTISGVKEDVLEILLNLKQVRLNINGDLPQTLEIQEKGPSRGEKVITAGDIKTPPQVKVVNPELPLLTLTSPRAKIDIEMQAQRGYGYVPAETFKSGKGEIGVLYLDASFGPIKKVGFRVEDMRVGKTIDFNRLIIDITTDGTIKPNEALTQSCEILISYFQKIKDSVEKLNSEKEKISPKKKKSKK